MSTRAPAVRKAVMSRKPEAAEAAAPAGSAIEIAYERIYAAIIDHSLPPGVRLIENRLCEIFGLGRTRVRQVLQKLASERLVTLLPNRGAIVTLPTVQEALDIFEARRLLEPAITARFVAKATRADVQRIKDHLQKEKAAARRNDRRAAIRLSGEFHLIIAECAGNATLLELLRELVSRSSLIIAVYQEAASACCPPDEHQELVTALDKRRDDAAQLMLEHLDHVLADLRLQEPETPGVDLLAILGEPA
ncbi:MAG: GntR family transcriptional regulator [Solimonas sp.]